MQILWIYFEKNILPSDIQLEKEYREDHGIKQDYQKKVHFLSLLKQYSSFNFLNSFTYSCDLSFKLSSK
jgi:hypothetical protein